MFEIGKDNFRIAIPSDSYKFISESVPIIEMWELYIYCNSQIDVSIPFSCHCGM